MYLLKFETDYGRLYLVNPKPTVKNITLNLSEPVDSISGESVKNFLSNIEEKFKKEPQPAEKKEPPEEKKEESEKEKPKKASLATIIRQYASTLKD